MTPAPQYPAQQPHPLQSAPADRWGPACSRLPKSSGYRIASGIIAIVLGCFLFLPAIALIAYASSYLYPAAGAIAILALVAALGNLTSGIVLLAKHRGRRRAAPVAVLSIAAFPVLLGLAGFLDGVSYAILLIISAVLSIPLFIIMGIGLAREKRGL
jgi:MFS family permease